jgi:ABC-type branched-subunit amino acid transport system substrate-binding protein
MQHMTRRTILAAAPVALAVGTPILAARPARAAKHYDPGVTDTEIKIGNTAPYSGPASNYSTIWKCEAAYYDMINAQGGINGDRRHQMGRSEGSSLDDRLSAQLPKRGAHLRRLCVAE